MKETESKRETHEGSGADVDAHKVIGHRVVVFADYFFIFAI